MVPSSCAVDLRVEMENSMIEDPSDLAPSIFQCGKCRSVLGDTLALIDADQEEQTLTLSGTSTRRGPR